MNPEDNIYVKGRLHVEKNCFFGGLTLNGEEIPDVVVEFNNVIVVTPDFFMENIDQIKSWIGRLES